MLVELSKEELTTLEEEINAEQRRDEALRLILDGHCLSAHGLKGGGESVGMNTGLAIAEDSCEFS